MTLQMSPSSSLLKGYLPKKEDASPLSPPFCFPWKLVRKKQGREGWMFCLPSCGSSKMQDPLKLWNITSCSSKVGFDNP